MAAWFLSEQDLAGLVTDLRASGATVIAPARGRDGAVEYRCVERAADALLDGSLPRFSLKEHFLPPSEPLFAWRQRHGGVELDAVPAAFAPRVVLGAKPCDAAALDIVDRVMGWDYRDDLWFARRSATTVIACACQGVDGSCFCPAVGLSPAATRGADVLLVPVDGGFVAHPVGDEGSAFVHAHRSRFREDAQRTETLIPGAHERVAANLRAGAGQVRRWVEAHFEDGLWRALAERCHGCGACAAVCPTCHCFDIVDEPEGVGRGVRRRNWDTCQTARFTVHASGHNPRADQGARLRQRVNHKFAIYPARFGDVLCTGCGRCARACPAGIDLPEILGRIADLAGQEVAP